MTWVKATVALCAGLLASAPGQAGENHLVPVEVGVHVEAAAGIPSDRSDFAEVTLVPVWEGDVSASINYRLSARVRFEGSDRLAPGQPDLSGYSYAGRPLAIGDTGVIELRDAYADFALGDVDLRLGKQQIVWGKLYGFKILDAINPQSFRRFILEDFDKSRVGLWSVSARTPLGAVGLPDWRAQLVFAPDATVHELPTSTALFALQAPRFRFGAPPGTGEEEPLAIELQDGALENAVYGGRVSGMVSGLDLAFVIISGLDPEPLPKLQMRETGAELIRTHERRTLYGVSAAGSFGRTVIRFESGYSPDRAVVTRGVDGMPSFRKEGRLATALALDVSGPFDTLMSVQVLEDHVLGDITDAVRPRSDTLVSAFLRRDFADERIGTSLQLLAADDLSDFVLRTRVSYEFDDTSEVSLNADIFSGDQNDIFGQFDDRDFLSVSWSRVF